MLSAGWSFDVEGSLNGCSNVSIDVFFLYAVGNGAI